MGKYDGPIIPYELLTACYSVIQLLLELSKSVLSFALICDISSLYAK